MIESYTSSGMHSGSGGRADLQTDSITQLGGLCVGGLSEVEWEPKAVRVTILPDGGGVFELVFKR